MISIPLWTGYQPAVPGMQFVENIAWIPALHANYALGVDGISIALIVLTAFTSVLVILGSWGPIKERVAQYMAAMLVLEGSADRRVRRDRRVAVLRVLRRHADPDVHHHRRLGRPAPRLCDA